MRSLVLLVATVVVFAAGWVTARAQNAQPNFELIIDAPGGETSVRCVRGCTLSWVERGVNANARATAKFGYSCTGERCGSGRIGGWLVP